MTLQLNTDSGLIAEARQVPSPNFDDRPAGEVPRLIVIHCISLPPREYGGPWIDALFTNSLDPDAHPYFADVHQLRVSAHLLIRRNGELVQYVPFHHRAWHAGVSSYCGEARCNDFSVGIELEGSDDDSYEPEQYRLLARVIAALEQGYPTLSRERITGHSEIAPGRKTDPGPGFDWKRLQQELERLSAA